MQDEQTPLLDESAPRAATVDSEALRAEVDHEAVYKRFTEGRKSFIVFIVSWGGLIPCACISISVRSLVLTTHVVFVSGSFVPSIPQIALEFGTTGAAVK